MKQVYVVDPKNQELVILVKYISAARTTTDLMIIIVGIIIKEKHFDNNLNDSMLFACSEIGYTNNLLSLK